jgi:MFS family permease
VAYHFTIAKILDVFGRPQGFLLCIILASLGLVMMALYKHVESYAAELVFYTVGNAGLLYKLGVFVADTSSLRNRGLMVAFSISQDMVTCWLGGPVANVFVYSLTPTHRRHPSHSRYFLAALAVQLVQ